MIVSPSCGVFRATEEAAATRFLHDDGALSHSSPTQQVAVAQLLARLLAQLLAQLLAHLACIRRCSHDPLKVATGISQLPERHPVTYAKEVATLDSMSGGRFMRGIGIGWLREEFEALEIPWERRTHRTEEYADVMRELRKSDGVAYDGEFINFENLSSNPKPTNGWVPIDIGGHSEAAAKRAGRKGDDEVRVKMQAFTDSVV
jgi:hypothetical protein